MKKNLADFIPQKIKIVILIPSFDMGGAERQALQFAESVKKRNSNFLDIEIFGFFNPGRTSQMCEVMGIKWSLVTYPSSTFLPRRLIEMVKLLARFRRAKPDIILPYTFVPNVICGLLWRWTGAKICIWNQRDGGIHYDIPFLEKLAIKNINHFVSNSRQGGRFISTCFSIREEKIKIIPNGVSLPTPKKSREEWRKDLNITQNSLIVCMVANLTELKDHKTLLRSWRTVMDSFSGYENKPVLLLAGKQYGTYNDLVTLTDELNIQNSVYFLGQVDDISGLLHSADLGGLSSKLEGCSNGLLECMAAGLPIIATDISANREALGKGNEHCLVPEENPEILSEKIIEFLKDENVRKKYGLMNRNRILQKFSPEYTNKMMLDYLI